MSFLSRRRDSNTRPLRPERSALPTAPLLDLLRKSRFFGIPNFLDFYESGCKGTAFFLYTQIILQLFCTFSLKSAFSGLNGLIFCHYFPHILLCHRFR